MEILWFLTGISWSHFKFVAVSEHSYQTVYYSKSLLRHFWKKITWIWVTKQENILKG